MEKERLDIKTLKTVEDLNSVNFSQFANDQFKNWVKYIVYPVSTNDLNRLCELAESRSCKVRLWWSMGDLYYKEKG